MAIFLFFFPLLSYIYRPVSTHVFKQMMNARAVKDPPPGEKNYMFFSSFNNLKSTDNAKGNWARNQKNHLC